LVYCRKAIYLVFAKKIAETNKEVKIPNLVEETLIENKKDSIIRFYPVSFGSGVLFVLS